MDDENLRVDVHHATPDLIGRIAAGDPASVKRFGPRQRAGRLASTEKRTRTTTDSETSMLADAYQHLRLATLDGVTTVTINRPHVYNAANQVLHDELVKVWVDLGRDPATRVVVITGAGKAFCAGGDFELTESLLGNFDAVGGMLQQAGALVHNLVSFDKPVISAINGIAVGAGLTVALLADISIIARGVRLTDGHTRFGLAAGDHAVLLWPILCGLAKAKHLLLTGEFIEAEEAERIGLVSQCVAPEELLPVANSVARSLADGPQYAIRWTKRSLNGWLRQATPMFEHSLALEMLTLLGADARAGLAALRDGRTPTYPSVGSV
jgi:enoyl-CoA hydratase